MKKIEIPRPVVWFAALSGLWALIQGAIQHDHEMAIIGIWIMVATGITAVNVNVYNKTVDNKEEIREAERHARELLNQTQELIREGDGLR